jgi:hypothetical protein
MTTTTTIREAARQAIIDAVQDYWERSMSLNYHSMILGSDGEISWSKKINHNECGVDEYYGRQRGYCTLVTVGLGSCGWNGADEDVYETRALTPDERLVVARDLRENRNEYYFRLDEEIDLGGGNVARNSSEHPYIDWRDRRDVLGKPFESKPFGTHWYCQTSDLLHWSDANDGISDETMVESALESLEEIPVGFFDDEEALGDR